MIYKYRWFLVVTLNFFFLLLEFFYVISPTLNDIIHLYVKEKQLLNRINKINIDKMRYQSIQKKSVFSVSKQSLNAFEKNDFEHISDLVKLFQVHGIMVQSIKLLSSSKQTDRKLLRITFQGQYNQFSSFLSHLTLKSNHILILDFSCQIAKQNNLLITMNILLLKKIIPKFSIPISSRSLNAHLNYAADIVHPFCPESGFNA